MKCAGTGKLPTVLAHAESSAPTSLTDPAVPQGGIPCPGLADRAVMRLADPVRV